MNSKDKGVGEMSVIEKLHNPQVYCTRCLFFRIDDEGIPYCYHEEECYIHIPEDSTLLSDRPCYTPKEDEGKMFEGCLMARLQKIKEIANKCIKLEMAVDDCLQQIRRISDISELMWWKR